MVVVDDSSRESDATVPESVSSEDGVSIDIISDSSDGEPNRRSHTTVPNKKRRIVSTDSIDENALIQKALAVMDEKSDDFDIFGQCVASELRQMTDISIQRSIKSEIMRAVMSYGDRLATNNMINTNTVASTGLQYSQNHHTQNIHSLSNTSSGVPNTNATVLPNPIESQYPSNPMNTWNYGEHPVTYSDCQSFPQYTNL